MMVQRMGMDMEEDEGRQIAENKQITHIEHNNKLSFNRRFMLV